jgi:hypothetical protein
VNADRHLLAVWNPSYASDAMHEHLALLLRLIGDYRAGKLKDTDDVFVWWGKIRSENRQKPLAHFDDVLAVGQGLETRDGEAHIYLTDYRSLYVGELLEITTDDVREDEDAPVPSYYAGQHCDCWFGLGDIRRLADDDTLQVIAELRRLRNVHYNDRPVSLYGGMVDLPLVVTRPDGARFFDRREREELLEGKFWAEIDAAQTGLGAIERELRENLLGDGVWSVLEPSARTFLASAEHLLRTNRHAPGFDFSGAVLNLAKACEVQANEVVRRCLRRLTPAARLVKLDGRTGNLTDELPLSLGTLGRALVEEAALRTELAESLRDGPWFVDQFSYVLRHLARYRNPAAHGGTTNVTDALRLRNQLLGVGCHGDLIRLGGVTIKGEA